MSLSELIYGFFEFYSHFNYHQHQISLNEPWKTEKAYWKFFGRMRMDQLTFIIEDPLLTDNNCAKNVRENTAELLINEFKRAQYILLYGGNWKDDVCCSNLMQQPQCYDRYTLSNQINFYRQHCSNVALASYNLNVVCKWMTNFCRKTKQTKPVTTKNCTVFQLEPEFNSTYGSFNQ